MTTRTATDTDLSPAALALGLTVDAARTLCLILGYKAGYRREYAERAGLVLSADAEPVKVLALAGLVKVNKAGAITAERHARAFATNNFKQAIPYSVASCCCQQMCVYGRE